MSSSDRGQRDGNEGRHPHGDCNPVGDQERDVAERDPVVAVCVCDCLLDVFHTPIISYISAFCQGRRHRIGGQFLILSKFFCVVSRW